MKKLLTICIMFASLLTACQMQDAYTGEQKTSSTTKGALIGGLAGAGAGLLLGGNNRGTGALIGGLAGAAAGGGIGYYMDSQEEELRNELRASGVSVMRYKDEIVLIMPGNITFRTDSYDINASFYTTLNAVAKVLNKYDDTNILVIGHTDNTGSATHNELLSLKRANAVASYLMSQQVEKGRIDLAGVGPAQPIADNKTAAGREQNRRVEIKIIPGK